MIAALGLLLQLSQPRWAALQDIRLGGPVDAIWRRAANAGPVMRSVHWARGCRSIPSPK